jgi:hypothetical protein
MCQVILKDCLTGACVVKLVGYLLAQPVVGSRGMVLDAVFMLAIVHCRGWMVVEPPGSTRSSLRGDGGYLDESERICRHDRVVRKRGGKEEKKTGTDSGVADPKIAQGWG